MYKVNKFSGNFFLDLGKLRQTSDHDGRHASQNTYSGYPKYGIKMIITKPVFMLSTYM
jgi:hypothetical protein